MTHILQVTYMNSIQSILDNDSIDWAQATDTRSSCSNPDKKSNDSDPTAQKSLFGPTSAPGMINLEQDLDDIDENELLDGIDQL